jgi:hypothetical protein
MLLLFVLTVLITIIVHVDTKSIRHDVIVTEVSARHQVFHGDIAVLPLFVVVLAT